MDGAWEQDTAKGADAPSIKFNGEYSIDTSGVTGSLTVIEYLLFEETFTPTLAEPISTIQVCANAYGVQRFTAEDGTKTNYPIIPAIIIKQDGKLFINSGSPTTIDYRCFSQWRKTVRASDFLRLVSGESGTSLISEYPDFYCTGGDIQLGIGLLHQIVILESGTSTFKSLVAAAHFDNMCLNVSRSVPCYPSRPDFPDLAMTISGSSSSMGGTCAESAPDIDGTWIVPRGASGTWFNPIFPPACAWLYPYPPRTFSQIGELLWDCNDGDRKQVAMWLSVYSENGGPEVSAQIGFYRRTGGPGVLYFWFEYGISGDFGCDETIELTIVGLHTYSTFGTSSFSSGATSYTLSDGDGPDFSITVPATITLDHA